MGCRHAAMPKKKSDCTHVHFAPEVRICAQGLQLGTEYKMASVSGIVEWFFPKSITPKCQAPVSAVPHCKGKHSIETLNRRLDSPSFERREHHFSIRISTEGVSRLFFR